MTQFSWQEAINPQLLQRLLRPMEQPGVLNDTLAIAIFERANKMLQRLSLLQQFEQRWAGLGAFAIDEMPLVYAQWAVAPDASSAATSAVVPLSTDATSQTEFVSPLVPLSTNATSQTEFVSPPQPTAPLIVQAEFVPTPVAAATSPPLVNVSTSLDHSSQVDHSSQIDMGPVGNDFNQAPSQALTSDTPSNSLPGENPVVSRDQSPLTEAQPQSLPVLAPITPGRVSQEESQLTGAKGESHTAVEAVVLATAIAPSSTLPTVKLQQTFDNNWNTPLPSVQTPSLSAASASLQPASLPKIPLPVIQQVQPSSSSLLAGRYPFENVPLDSVSPPKKRVSAGEVMSQTTPLPLVLSKISTQTAQATIAQGDVNGVPEVAMPSKRDNLSPAIPPQPISLSNNDINRLTQQVERKLMRRLTVERERRGQQSWR